MEKYLITGFSGFVSKHFLNYLDSLKINATVLGLDVNQPPFKCSEFLNLRCEFKEINLLDQDEVRKVIFDFQPNYVLHLASYSSVAFSWKNPITSFSNNTNIFLTLIEQIRELDIPCRVLSVGSSEEYGNVAPQDVPLTEEHVLKPLSPYAVARVSQEMLSKVYVDGFGIDIILTRSFNHIGPGQRDIFVISSFAKQLVQMKRSGGASVLATGDLSIIRDFLDVRDVVRAYHFLLLKGKKGELYNICSGEGTSLEKVVQSMIEILDFQVTTKVNPKLLRPNDNPIIIGSNKKLKEEIGWNAQYSLAQSLKDIIEYWKEAS